MSERTMQWVVESFGESSARVEVDGDEVVPVPRSLLPDDAREGDVLVVTVRRDAAARERALAASREQLAEAPVDRSSGDIAL